MYVDIYVNAICMHVFEHFSGLRTLAEAKVLPYGGTVDNKSLSHVFSAVGFPERESAARDHNYHSSNVMVSTVAAIVARDVGPDSSLSILRQIN